MEPREYEMALDMYEIISKSKDNKVKLDDIKKRYKERYNIKNIKLVPRSISDIFKRVRDYFHITTTSKSKYYIVDPIKLSSNDSPYKDITAKMGATFFDINAEIDLNEERTKRIDELLDIKNKLYLSKEKNLPITISVNYGYDYFNHKIEDKVSYELEDTEIVIDDEGYYFSKEKRIKYLSKECPVKLTAMVYDYFYNSNDSYTVCLGILKKMNNNIYRKAMNKKNLDAANGKDDESFEKFYKDKKLGIVFKEVDIKDIAGCTFLDLDLLESLSPNKNFNIYKEFIKGKEEYLKLDRRHNFVEVFTTIERSLIPKWLSKEAIYYDETESKLVSEKELYGEGYSDEKVSLVTIFLVLTWTQLNRYYDDLFFNGKVPGVQLFNNYGDVITVYTSDMSFDDSPLCIAEPYFEEIKTKLNK